MQSKRFSKILIVNPYGIGDVLFTTPLIRQLRRNFPYCFIACLLGSRTNQILENNPDIDKIFTFDKGAFDAGSLKEKINTVFALLRDLKKRHFDLMIDISNAPEYAFWAKFFLGTKTRIGFNYKARGRFLTGSIKLEGYRDKHIIEYYLDLIRLLGIEADDDRKINLCLNEEDNEFTDRFLKSSGYDGNKDKLFCIIPGGGKSWGKDAVYKHWPLENFAWVSNQVYEQLGLRTLILGSVEESDLAGELAGLIKHNCINACGKSRLRQSAALMARSEVVLTNDSGPLHMAVSQRVKTVSIFGPVDEKVYGPYPLSDKNAVLTASVSCRPCYRDFKFKKCLHRNCLQNISPHQVFCSVKAHLT